MSVRSALTYVAVGAAAVLLVGAGAALYGAYQYRAGGDARQAEIEKRQAAVERGWQEERDLADAQYRGAVLAREAAKTGLVAARAELDRVLRANGRDPANPRAGGRPDEAGADWIGGFAACYAEYGGLAADAAEWADQVNGLQGYIRGLLKAQPGGGREASR